MPHSEIIDKKSFALGVLFEAQDIILKNFKGLTEQEKEIFFRMNRATSILNEAFIDEKTFENMLMKIKIENTKAMAIIERQRREIENLKSNIK